MASLNPIPPEFLMYSDAIVLFLVHCVLTAKAYDR